MAKQSDQTECKLFTLPPELRNEIYELAFSIDSDKPIALLLAVPPSNSFILTCRQVRDEAAGIYREAYQAFWTKGHFVLTLARRDEDELLVIASIIIRSATQDWEQMRSIMISYKSHTFHYLPEHRLWEYRSAGPKRFGSMVIPENADATSILPDMRLSYKSHRTLDEALLAAKGRRGPMVNQLRTFAI
ncbi:hypothetical protein LTR17_010254 [Elasticomyces elasticus]|nr:hypothetical protein LTR17_010254 [Elasticomyces elasticus]